MAVSLKVNLKTIGTTKTMRFMGEMSISEVTKEIREKVPNAGGSDHGIFQPGTVTQKPRWLRVEKTLRFYDLQSGMEIEYKKKHRQLKVRLLDETVRTFLIDESQTVAALTEHVGYKMGIKNPEEFSFKIDGPNGQDWLNPTLSLPEQGVNEDQMVLLKKKFFFNDANVDRSDPVQLHLLYVQSRDAIVSGDHPCTKEEARDLGALQCQITNGDFNPAKHKNLFPPGKLKEFLPPQYHKVKLIDKEISREYQKLIGMSEVNAKYRYVQLCRSLKTYGITCFMVKEKRKKKLAPVLIGVTRHAILRMEAETKEVIKEYPLPHLKRWAASPTAFTMDFGEYEDSYYSVLTNEAEAISQLIAGYIDIILKTRKDAARVVEDDEPEQAYEEHVAPVYGQTYSSVTTSHIGRSWDSNAGIEYGPPTGTMPNYAMQQQQFAKMMQVNNVKDAVTSVATIVDNFQNPSLAFALGTPKLPVSQSLSVLTGAAGQLAAAIAALGTQTVAPTAVDAAAKTTLSSLGDLIASAKAVGEQTEDSTVLDGAQSLSEAIKQMLQAAAACQLAPTETANVEAFRESQLGVQAAATYVQAATTNTLADQVSQNLVLESAKAVAAAATAAVSEATIQASAAATPAAKQEIINAARAHAAAASKVMGIATALAPGVLNPAYVQQIETACKAVAETNQVLCTAVSAANPSAATAGVSSVLPSAQSIDLTVGQLISATTAAGKQGKEPFDLITPLEDTVSNVEQLLTSAKVNPALVPTSAGAIQSAANSLATAAKAIVSFAPPDKQIVLLERTKTLSEAANRIGQSARAAVASTGDAYSMGQVVSAGQATLAAMQALLADAPEAVVNSVAYWAKAAAAQTSSLIAAATPVKSKDPALAAAVETATVAVANLVESIKNHAQGVPNSGAAVVAAAKSAAAPVATLLGAVKHAAAHVEEPDKKFKIAQALSDATPALQKMVTSVKIVAEASQPRPMADAAEQLRAVVADLDVAVIAAEAAALPRTPGFTADTSTAQLSEVCKSLLTYSASVASSAQSIEAVGTAAKAMASQVLGVATAAKALAAFAPEPSTQKQMVVASKAVTVAAQSLTEALKQVADNNTPASQERAAKCQEDLSKAVNHLLSNSRGLDTGELDEAADVLAAEAERMRVSPPAKVTVPQEVFINQAYELVGATKALGTSLSSVAAMAQGSPKMMAVAAKTAAASVSPFIDAANMVIATCPDPAAHKYISRSSMELANVGARLILAAKAVALGDESQKKILLDGAAAMQKAMDTVLENVAASQPGHKEITEQQRKILQVRTKVDFGGTYEKQDIRQLSDACRALSDICNTIPTVAQTSPEILSSFSARITAAADTVANIARSAADPSVGSIPPEFAAPMQQAVTALLIASACPRGDRNRALASAKDVTLATATIVKQAKVLAASIRDPVQRRNAILATEKLATATVALAQAAKVAMQPALVETTREALKDVRAAISTAGDPAAEQLIEAARAVTAVAAKVIEASSAVNSNPKDGTNQIKLSTVAKSMPVALQAIQHAASALQPAVKECDEAIAEVEYAVSELDSAGIAVAFGQMEPLGGRTYQESTNELTRAAKDISAELKNLSNPKDAAARARAATAIKATMGSFVMAVKATLSSTSNRQTQEAILTRSKELADALQCHLYSVRTAATGGVNDIPRTMAETEKALAILNSSLKGNSTGVREIEEAIKEVNSAVKSLEHMPQATSKAYKQAKVELKFQTQDLVKDVSELVTIAKMNAEDAGSTAKAISARLPVLMATVKEAAAGTNDPKAKINLIGAGKKVGKAIQQTLQTARQAASDPKNRNLQKDLAKAYTQVGQSVTALLDACYSGTPGERECEDAAYTLSRTVADLDASVLFAAAGAVDINTLTNGRNYEACHADLLNVTKQISDACKQFQAAANEGPEQAGVVALQISEFGVSLALHCKALGALGGDKQANLKLIDACKTVEASAQQLIKTGKDAHGQPEVQALVTEAVDLVLHSSKQLTVVAESLSEQTVRGLVEMDKVKALTNTLVGAYESPDFLGDTEADAQAVVEAARAVASATGELVVGCNAGQEDIVKACTQSSTALRRLFEATKGASATTQRSDVRASLANAARNVAESMMVLIDACKGGSRQKTLQAQAAVSQVARECADKLQEVVAAANLLPGGEGLQLEEETVEDLDQLAEQELSVCATMIDTMAKELLTRPTNVTVNINDEVVPENLTESILDASKSISQATTALVRGALTAQRERVTKLGNPKTKHLYHKDPAWANGLISCSQKVGAVIRELVSAADLAAKGQAEEERLVACARAVAAATAQLVAASRAKADPGSQAQQKLSAVAKAVASATSQLVEAARLQAEQKREEKAINRRFSLTNSVKADFEKQIEILKLEKALEQARSDLARNRKSQYSKNG